MPRATYGDRASCTCCGQDIEFHGGRFGWLDRGSDRFCQMIFTTHDGWVRLNRPRLHRPACA